MRASTDAGLLMLRLVVLLVMAFHGTQKLFGWWDGGGLDHAERFFAGQGFRPPRLMALVASVTECVGALLVGLGALTAVGVAMLTGVLANVVALHARNGLDHRRHGCELELTILAGVVAIGLAGPGDWSLDRWLGTPGPPWLGLAAVVLGAVGGLFVVSTRSRDRGPVPTP